MITMDYKFQATPMVFQGPEGTVGPRGNRGLQVQSTVPFIKKIY